MDTAPSPAHAGGTPGRRMMHLICTCLLRGPYTVDRTHQLAESRAANLEIGELIERRAGRREQDHGFLESALRGLARREGDRAIEGADDRVGDAAVECGGERLRRLADQIGLANAREEPGEGLDAAGLRPAPRDPEDIREARQRARGGVRVRRLRIVDEQYM